MLHVWDRKFGTKLGELVPEDVVPGQTVDGVIWSQDKALLAIAYNKGSIRIYRVRDLIKSTNQPDVQGSNENNPGSSNRASGSKVESGAGLANQYNNAESDSRRRGDKEL